MSSLARVVSKCSSTSFWLMAPLILSGLLQPGNTIRAIMTAGGAPQAEIASRVAIRIGATGGDHPREAASLPTRTDHSALCQDVGGRQVATDQLNHLLDTAKRPDVELRTALVAAVKAERLH